MEAPVTTLTPITLAQADGRTDLRDVLIDLCGAKKTRTKGWRVGGTNVHIRNGKLAVTAESTDTPILSLWGTVFAEGVEVNGPAIGFGLSGIATLKSCTAAGCREGFKCNDRDAELLIEDFTAENLSRGGCWSSARVIRTKRTRIRATREHCLRLSNYELAVIEDMQHAADAATCMGTLTVQTGRLAADGRYGGHVHVIGGTCKGLWPGQGNASFGPLNRGTAEPGQGIASVMVSGLTLKEATLEIVPGVDLFSASGIVSTCVPKPSDGTLKPAVVFHGWKPELGRGGLSQTLARCALDGKVVRNALDAAGAVWPVIV